ncbi:hypothetical protein ABB37_04764 [Leptomonas pyrrhocoris]|uniref:BRCT domain-containing protein n=1 Tax=Leptomonas pyrrhocoris TaxID=157538 RepID=A0A0M9G1M3_LEPPY|nr:hypothetical protein ABB37_04764 [Leptomonas pyrrhocoris]KPA80560.1 hypothetical protein ABB37_04764 [Leptomonas pyrrhocoris]|eukprot:XP_015658999.1 hypothetical protein ABB37_04764 [Leptomonas pyrrhocoris]
MDVPATRPEVTTTGIYGEELSQVRQRLIRNDLSWCGDLTARTQVLIVGRVAPVGSRKLAVARSRRLPCVSPTWVTAGACSLDSTDAFDVCHELSGREVCTTSLNHLERDRVQAVCTARGAQYNLLLTRQCSLLIAPTSALAFTSPSAASPATANDKIRFARRHGIWTLSVEEFALRYGGESVPKQDLASTSPGVVSRSQRDAQQLPSLRRSSGLGESSSHIRHDVLVELKGDMSRDATTSADPSSNLITRDVLVSRSVRCTALSVQSAPSTPRPSAAAVNTVETYKAASALHSLDVEESLHHGVGVALSAVQPTLPSQLSAIAATGASVAPSQSPRSLEGEFSDVVAYCSPPHCLTTEQHDLLCGMGVGIASQLTPFTTHVLVLGETVEECLYPRPGLQIVSWRWVSQSQLEQRRLSCAGFRVHLEFHPVVTFTGLSASDKHELVAALRHSGLPCEVQEALVLGGAVRKPAFPADASRESFLPRSTTHLVSLRHQLLESQKVAVLAQHCLQHTRRPSASSLASSSLCRLVGVDWIYRSIQHGQWLDPELFTLTLPHPEAFVLAAARKTKMAERPLSSLCHHSQSLGMVRSSAVTGAAPLPLPQRGRPSSQPSPSPSVATGIATACASSQFAPPPPSLHYSGRSPPRAEAVVVMEGLEEREEEEGAALSQPNAPTTSNDAPGLLHGSPLSSSTPLPVVQQDEDDEAAGGESPSATAAFRSAVQAIHASQPPRPSQAERQASTSSSSGQHGGTGSSTNNTSDDDHGGDGGGASPSDNHPTLSLQHTAQTGTSYTFLGTQYSPTFENLLGELEAFPPSVLGGGVPFSLLGEPARIQFANALSLAGQISDASRAQDAESALNSPPTFVSAHEWQQQTQQSVLQRASLHRQRLPPRQQPFSLPGGNISDESQVIFYQMGVSDHGAVSAPSPGGSQSNPQTSNADAVLGSATTASSAATKATPAREGVDGPANSNARSFATSAVLLITKDVLKGNDFDWDAFAARFPHCRRTSKPEECTHFITAKPSKTEQFLCCLAAGHWILTPAYLSACAAAGYLVKEDPFEWGVEVAAVLSCRSSVVSLVRGCKVQRLAPELPFAGWQVRVCCTSAARTDSFLRVLRNGGCTSLQTVTAEEVLASAKASKSADSVDSCAAEATVVLADDAMFTEEELEDYVGRVAVRHRCPILRLDYLVQHLCSPGTPRSEMDLLHCLRSRKRSRTESSPAH